MWIIFSVLFIIVLLIGYLIYKKWSTSVISIPLGIWLCLPVGLLVVVACYLERVGVIGRNVLVCLAACWPFFTPVGTPLIF